MAFKRKIKNFTKNLFNRFFGFEEGVDITNEVAVLYRRNIVIKNILFISNMFYSLILFFVAASPPIEGGSPILDWIFPGIFLPFTFFLNTAIKKLIQADRHDLGKQQIGMFIMAFYAFVSVILFYLRFRFYKVDYFETPTYVLIYFALIVISLYQSKTLLLWSSAGMFSVMTIIHFTVTYKFNSPEMLEGGINDIILRSVVFLLFVVVLYAIVSIGHYMQEQRKNELIKRKQIQDDYKTIVSDLLGIVMSSKNTYLDYQHNSLVKQMTLHLATLYGLSSEVIEELGEYILIHTRIDEIEDLIKLDQANELPFNDLKGKTKLATEIAKRLQLAQKTENIARTHIDGSANHNFIVEMQSIQPNIESQMILLTDLYITMRSPKSFKRAYPNQMVIKLFKEEFNHYFDYKLVDRFIRFQEEFSKMFEENY